MSEFLSQALIEAAAVADEMNDNPERGAVDAVGYPVGLAVGRKVKTAEPRKRPSKLFAGKGGPTDDLRKVMENEPLRFLWKFP